MTAQRSCTGFRSSNFLTHIQLWLLRKALLDLLYVGTCSLDDDDFSQQIGSYGMGLVGNA